MLKRITCAIFVLWVASLAMGQASKAPKPDRFASELQKLQQQYFAAEQVYYAPYQKAKTPEEMQKIKLDPKKNPVPVYLPKFEKLANKAGKTQSGFQAWMMVKQLAEEKQDKKLSDEADRTLMSQFMNTPWFGQYVSMIPYQQPGEPQAERVKKLSPILMSIESKATAKDTKAAALYARAQLIAGDGHGDAATAAKLYKRVLDLYPSTEPGKRVVHDIYEMEHLTIGKEAPDFTAQDQDGTTFHLSDYRGKVVVLDFWGFW